MLRDGMLDALKHSRLEALDRKREVRIAREAVIKDQREAEWSFQERHMAAQRLISSKESLTAERQEVTRWKLRNAKKLKKKRSLAREQRQDKQLAEQRLAESQLEYKKARRRFRILANESDDSEQGGGEDSESQDLSKKAAEVESRRQAVRDAEKDVDKTSSDAEWLDRGLRRNVQHAKTEAQSAREDLLEARARERVAKKKLEKSKYKYVHAVQQSKEADKASEVIEERLRTAPTTMDEQALNRFGSSERAVPPLPAEPSKSKSTLTEQRKSGTTSTGASLLSACLIALTFRSA